MLRWKNRWTSAGLTRTLMKRSRSFLRSRKMAKTYHLISWLTLSTFTTPLTSLSGPKTPSVFHLLTLLSHLEMRVTAISAWTSSLSLKSIDRSSTQIASQGSRGATRACQSQRSLQSRLLLPSQTYSSQATCALNQISHPLLSLSYFQRNTSGIRTRRSSHPSAQDCRYHQVPKWSQASREESPLLSQTTLTREYLGNLRTSIEERLSVK